jgi:hypothetical protein
VPLADKMLISERESSLIFVNIVRILEIHKEMLKAFESKEIENGYAPIGTILCSIMQNSTEEYCIFV